MTISYENTNRKCTWPVRVHSNGTREFTGCYGIRGKLTFARTERVYMHRRLLRYSPCITVWMHQGPNTSARVPGKHSNSLFSKGSFFSSHYSTLHFSFISPCQGSLMRTIQRVRVYLRIVQGVLWHREVKGTKTNAYGNRVRRWSPLHATLSSFTRQTRRRQRNEQIPMERNFVLTKARNALSIWSWIDLSFVDQPRWDRIGIGTLYL